MDKPKKSCGCGCETSKRKECDCNIIHADMLEKAKQNMLDDETLMNMADFYKALSDSTRIKIINALDESELCVCDISALLNMTKSAVSHQLQNLKDMNLITSRREGKEVMYSLADRHVKEVFEVSKEHVMEELNEQNC